MKKVLFAVFLFVFFLFVFDGLVSAVTTDDPIMIYLQRASIAKSQSVFTEDNSISLSYGSAIYPYLIEIPKGVRELQPSLSIYYNHQAMKKEPGLLGSGWILSQNYIERNVENSFSDTEDDTFNLILNGKGYKLDYDISEGKYHTKIERGEF